MSATVTWEFRQADGSYWECYASSDAAPSGGRRSWDYSVRGRRAGWPGTLSDSVHYGGRLDRPEGALPPTGPEILSAMAAEVGDAAAAWGGGPPPMDLVAHLRRMRAFGEEKFGPGKPTGVIKHIKKELKEIAADPSCLEEWVDVVILGFDGARRAGHGPEAIAAALVAKQDKIEARTWPDWRTVPDGEPIEHDRTGEAPEPAEVLARLRADATALGWDGAQPIGSFVEHLAFEVDAPAREGVGLTETFRRLAEASGGAWDAVDPGAYVESLRGRPGPPPLVPRARLDALGLYSALRRSRESPGAGTDRLHAEARRLGWDGAQPIDGFVDGVIARAFGPDAPC